VNLKLQINTSGAWRDVVAFDQARLPSVQDGTTTLAIALTQPPLENDGPGFRVVKVGPGRSPRVIAYLERRRTGRDTVVWSWKTR